VAQGNISVIQFRWCWFIDTTHSHVYHTNIGINHLVKIPRIEPTLSSSTTDLKPPNRYVQCWFCVGFCRHLCTQMWSCMLHILLCVHPRSCNYNPQSEPCHGQCWVAVKYIQLYIGLQNEDWWFLGKSFWPYFHCRTEDSFNQCSRLKPSWVSFWRALKFQGSQISALQLKGWFKSKTSIQEYTKLILDLCMNHMAHVFSTMWRVKI